MKRLLTLLALCCLMVTGAVADTAFRNHRYDTFKVMPINENSIVFVGNSITDMQLWAEAFGDNPYVVNRGNSGATSSEILANVRSYCAGHPAKIFLMIGINDKPNGSNTTTIVNNIKATVEAIQAESPSTQIYVQSIMPCGNTGFSNNTYISQVNSAIQSMVGQKTGVTYIDVYTPLVGSLDQGGDYSYDKLHPTAASSQIWMETIKQYVNGTNRYPSNTASVMTKSTLGNDSFGARATCMSMMPISSDDILFFGDEMVKNGEWNELLRNSHVKNRGTNWDYDKTVSSMTYCRGDIEATFATVSGVSKTAPKQILLYTGTGEVNGNGDINSIVDTYKGLVSLLRTHASATSTKISLVGLMPTKGYDNSRVKQFNAALQSYAATATNVEYIDIYTALSTNDQINTQYFTADNYYLYGPGYIKVAEILADHIEGCNPVTAAQASAYRALVNGNNADEAFFEEGLYQIQVGSGTVTDHANYKDYYVRYYPHTSGSYTWAMGLTQDATDEATYVYISGSHDNWSIKFNDGKYAAQNGLVSNTAAALQFIPNSDASEWKIMGGANRYWMGWNLSGPSIGSASGTSLTDAQKNCYFVFKKVDEREADEKFFEEGWYKIQVGNGTGATGDHTTYKDKYLYANPHDYVVGTTTYKYAIGLADSGSDPTAYVYITGSHDQWHMEFNHGRDNSYFVTTNCLYDKTTPGDLKFIPNDETNPTQWKIWGSWPEAHADQGQGDYRWMGWNLNGPSVGATSQIYDYNNNCYFIFTKTDAPVYPEEDPEEPAPATEITPGWYQIQIGSGTGVNNNHQTYKGKYLYANPHTVGTNNWGIGLTDDATDPATYVNISGSEGQWHMKFVASTSSYYIASNSLVSNGSAGNLSFIPNSDCTEWKIWGDNKNRWMGWDINGPSVGSTSTTGNSDYDNCYFVFKKADPVYKVGKAYIIKSVAHGSYSDRYILPPSGSNKKCTISTTKPTTADQMWVVKSYTDNGDGTCNVCFENNGQYFAFMATTTEANHSVKVSKFDVDKGTYVNIQDVLKYWPDKSTDNRTCYMAIKDDNGSVGWGTPVEGSSSIRTGGYSYQFAIEESEFTTVTYNFTVDGQSIGSKVVVEKFGAAPTVANVIPSYVQVTGGIPTTVEQDNYTIATTYNGLPFKVGFDYVVYFCNGNYYYWNDSNEGVGNEVRQGGNPSDISNRAALDTYTNTAYWTMGGDWLNGFTFKNKATGKYLVAPTSLSAGATFNLSSDNATTFDPKLLSHGYYRFYIHSQQTYFLAHTSHGSHRVTMYSGENYGIDENNGGAGVVQFQAVPSEGKIYKIVADFASYDNIYLTNNGSLTFPTSASNVGSYWVLRSSGDSNHPWAFQSGYGNGTYLNAATGCGDKAGFSITANGMRYLLNGSIGSGGYKNIGTWSASSGNTGFGNYGSGCYSSSGTSDGNWTTFYTFEPVDGYTVYDVTTTTLGGGVAPKFTGYAGVTNVSNGGIVLVPTGTELSEANFPAVEIAGFTGSVSFSGTTITVTYSNGIAELQAKINTLLGIGSKIGTVGYPAWDNTDVTTLLNYIDDGVTQANYPLALIAYEAVIGTSDVVLPQAGHAYKLSVRSSDGTKRWYLKNVGGVSGSESDAAVFVMGSSSRTDDYNVFFVTNDNREIKYLRSNGTIPSGTSAKNDTYTVGGNCDFHISPMVAASNDDITTDKEARFGTFCFKAACSHNSGVNGTLNVEEGTYPTIVEAENPKMNGTNSSAIEMTEVEYPYTKPTLIADSQNAKNGYFASIWLPFPMIVQEGVEVYKGTQVIDVNNNSYLNLEKVDTNRAVARGGYILYSEETSGEIWVQPYAGAPDDEHETADAAFYGSTENPGVADGGTEWSTFIANFNGVTPYVLSNKNAGIGFYKYTGTKLPKGKAIWMKPADASNAVCVKFGFGDIISAIEALHGHTTNAEIYDLQGHRLDKVQKGHINVINGQKIMFK